MIHTITPPAEYDQKEAGAVQQFQTLLAQKQNVAIKKNVKHIFKDRDAKPNLDLRTFNQVLCIDTDNQIASVEGMTSFYDLVAATLAYNLIPQAVPELRSITVGGAVAGLGGQSSSFRFGLVHEMVTDFDLLTGEGKVIHCSPEENADIFYMLPNSYGSLGYILKCTIKLNPVMPFVKLEYIRFSQREKFFQAIETEVQAAQVDFVEGVSFSPTQYILLKGNFCECCPSSEKPLNPLLTPFFKSVENPAVNTQYLTIKDYIWRWDADAFWATDQKNRVGSVLLNPLFRKTLGSSILRSDRLIKVGKVRNKFRKKINSKEDVRGAKRKEALIQDAALPFRTAAAFDAWLAKKLNIFPLWYCPVKTTKPIGTYPLYQPESEFVLDFGFYVSMELEAEMEPYYYNKQIEKKLLELGGLKCLYSDTFFDQAQFWEIYDKSAYEKVKVKYDPNNTYRDLYYKVVNQPE